MRVSRGERDLVDAQAEPDNLVHDDDPIGRACIPRPLEVTQALARGAESARPERRGRMVQRFGFIDASLDRVECGDIWSRAGNDRPVAYQKRTDRTAPRETQTVGRA